jgi:hypothetical protein
VDRDRLVLDEQEAADEYKLRPRRHAELVGDVQWS